MRSRVLHGCRDLDGAHAALSTALTLSPTFPDAMDNMALLLITMGRREEAAAFLGEALAVHPAHTNMLSRLRKRLSKTIPAL